VALPEQFQIKEYRQSLELLDDLRARVERGEVLSILAVCELSGGDMAGLCTATDNVYALFGYALSWTMRRMGFVNERDDNRS
jgi:hypothetical protein